MRRFEGRVALVTGASSGIGRACALAFAREGASVVLASRDAGRGEELAAECEAAGGAALFRATDVADEAAVEALVVAVDERFGRLDCAVNAAGTEGPLAELQDTAAADFDRAFAVNVRGVFLCLRAELRRMRAAGRGAVVNVASLNGLKGAPRSAAYCAGKHAVLGLTKVAAIESSPLGVRVNALCAGPHATPMLGRVFEAFGAGDAAGFAERYAATIPLRRLGRPEEAAEAALWLCSDAASFVTGACLSEDGGLAAF